MSSGKIEDIRKENKLAIDVIPMEICPVCESTLEFTNIYTTKDVFTGDKRKFCKVCHTELVRTNNGWERKFLWYER
jgi:RNA polymerase subunit RPABC4/transcription elongation factor Spt4